MEVVRKGGERNACGRAAVMEGLRACPGEEDTGREEMNDREERG